MSSILDALDKAKRDRENLNRGDAPAPSAPSTGAPAAAPSAEAPSAKGRPATPAPMESPARAAEPAQAPWPQQSPYYPPPPPYPAAPEGRGGNSALLGISFGVAAIALAALAFLLARDANDGATPDLSGVVPRPTLAPTVEATPYEAPLLAPQSHAPTASPSPIALRTPPAGLSIEDIRFATERPADDSMPVIVITPSPTPYAPKPATGDRATLLDPTATAPNPSPTPTPAPSPAATPLPGREIAPGTRELFSEEFDGFRIDAILHDSDRPVVMVGGREREKGEVVNGYLIDKIDPEAIEVTRDGVRYRVRF